jgi:PHD/YefM family antitoxin component YafN of YafNO toxin-antitoxin module
MHMFTERTQVLLSPEQAERLMTIAERQRRSVGAVIREVIDADHVPPQPTKQGIIEHLVSLCAPVDDWEVMKEQALEGALGEHWHPGWKPNLYPRAHA